MKNFLVPAALALLPLMGHAQYKDPTPIAQPEGIYGEESVAGPHRFDHMARVGSFDYYVWVDRSQSPPAAYATPTKESLDSLFSIKSRTAFKALSKKQQGLIKDYLRDLIADQTPRSGAAEPEPFVSLVEGDGEIDTLDLTKCVQNFPPVDRNKTYRFVDNWNTVDDVGRSGKSWIDLTTVVVPQKRGTCSTTVGYWGIAGDVGGHLVAAMLGGHGGRSNLVPKNGKLNNKYQATEYMVEYCAEQDFTPSYSIEGLYADKKILRPGVFDVYLTVHWPIFPPPPPYPIYMRLENKEPDLANQSKMMNFNYAGRTYCSQTSCHPRFGAESCT